MKFLLLLLSQVWQPLPTAEAATHCLAQNIYFEARNISIDSKVAVSWVTFNRVNHEKFPNSICEVVYQPKQFSWYWDGKADTPGTNILEQKAWAESKLIANNFIMSCKFGYGECPQDNTQRALFYHREDVTPYWTEYFYETTKIDNHIFYN